MASAQQAHMAKAVSQIQQKKAIPTIDFTVHHLDDGSTVSTQERVIKEARSAPYESSGRELDV